MREGIISFPSKYGVKTAKNTIIALGTLLMLFSLFPYINGNYGSYYIAVIIILVIPVLIYFLISLLKDDSHKNMKKLSFILKLDMVFGLIALYIGRWKISTIPLKNWNMFSFLLKLDKWKTSTIPLENWNKFSLLLKLDMVYELIEVYISKWKISIIPF